MQPPLYLKSNLGHDQVRLQHPKKMLSALIDVEIVPLISACWKLGINTQQSCWKYTERQETWIQFLTAKDALKFLSYTIPIAKHMQIVTNKYTEIWFPGHEIPTVTKALTKIPM
jgi:hypothetical protein